MAPTANTVLITVPRTAITSNNLPKLRPAPLTTALLKAAATPSASPTPSSSGYASSSNMDEDNMGASQPKAKKRRLDHLTWEEKVQRKKLKNRVAAQTSRDRKKARMEEMDYEIKELTDRTEILQNKCDSLQAINESLLAKNHKLDSELDLLRQELDELKKQQQHNTRCISQSNASAGAEGCASTNLGSAASKADPLPQGIQQVDTQSSVRLLAEQLKSSKSLASLWKVVALCLLYKTCLGSTKSSTSSASKSWPKVCSQISQQTWKQALERAAQLLPKMQATQSDCLDQWWGPQQSAWNPTGIELMA
ncbi:GM15809 [Drosophila sechellia]|uniref:X-box-binding protein 1 n=1 Tax=Drosophila sechellia TaxID=7238 RepID=B4I7K4_DROSE|nr:GM15809 [Drosophila sechellia]